MAYRKQTYGEENTKVYSMPSYSKASKMNLYNVFFDSDNDNKPRSGFYKYITFTDEQKKEMTVFTVTAEYENRIDSISTKFYNTSTYDWIIEMVNGIEDPIKDIVVGTKLLIPSEMDIYSIIG